MIHVVWDRSAEALATHLMHDGLWAWGVGMEVRAVTADCCAVCGEGLFFMKSCLNLLVLTLHSSSTHVCTETEGSREWGERSITSMYTESHENRELRSCDVERRD